MSEELENKNESLSAGQNEGSREGYKQTEGLNNRNGDKPLRPRIRVQRAYVPNRNYNKDDGGFRPEGFGSGLQSAGNAQRPYRPRYNAPQQGGYQQRGSYQQRPQAGYRPRYNKEGEEGYQPRQSQYGQRPQTGFRPRYNANGQEGGYQPRQGGYNRGTSSVADTVSSARAATTVRAVTVSIRPITTRMQSIA